MAMVIRMPEWVPSNLSLFLGPSSLASTLGETLIERRQLWRRVATNKKENES